MANRPENTVCYEGFRIFAQNIEGFKKYIADFKYAYIGYDGDYYGVWIVSKSNEESHEGMILEITADGIEISGEFKANRPPKMESLTADWKTLLKTHIENCREHWTLCTN